MKITSEGILFQPWIGNQYGESSLFKVPVLIIGESNYGESRGSLEEDSVFTHLLIENFMSRVWNLRFFNNIQRCFVEDAYTTDSRRTFWHSIAFYDYIQAWLLNHSMPPTEEMWHQAKPVFEAVVAELKPKCILFVCKRLYYRIACNYAAEQLFIADGEKRDACFVSDALATYILHPSRNGFRNSRTYVRALLQAVGGYSLV